MQWSNLQAKQLLTGVFEAGRQAVHGKTCVERSLRTHEGNVLSALSLTGETTRLSLDDYRRIVVVSVGKAAHAMAMGLPEAVRTRVSQGLIVTTEGAARPLPGFAVQEAGHPIPNRQSLLAARSVASLLRTLGQGDLVILLLSGGASSLQFYPRDGLEFEDVAETSRLLLDSGADIASVNVIRKHLCQLKGGGLSQMAFPADVLTLVLSDVIGDPLESVGSGPTVPDPSSFLDAWNLSKRWGLLDRLPGNVRRLLQRGVEGLEPDTPGPLTAIFTGTRNVLCGNSSMLVRACAQAARAAGVEVELLSAATVGESREAALTLVRQVAGRLHTESVKPLLFIAAGETTVTRPGSGIGGRNQEFALAAALELARHPGCALLSAGTDGRDGATLAAGAFAFSDTLSRALALGIDPAGHLAAHDSHLFFLPLGDLFHTGPTDTNVMDLQLLLVT